jgi:hypothetical protein
MEVILTLVSGSENSEIDSIQIHTSTPLSVTVRLSVVEGYLKY